MIVDVKDNFFQSSHFDLIRKIMYGKDFPWYFNEGILDYIEPRNFQFIHLLYRNTGRESVMWKDFRDIFIPKMKIKELYRVKANLTTRTIFHRGGGYHIDYDKVKEKQKTSIFYINTCNGYTKFKNGGKVKSVANRMVTFDSNLEHDGYTCTDKKRRVVVNFNDVGL